MDDIRIVHMLQRTRDATKLEKWGVGRRLTTNTVKAVPTYKFQSADVRMIHQVSAEVAFHHLVKEGEWVIRGRINTDEWDDVRVRKLVGCPSFLEKPL